MTVHSSTTTICRNSISYPLATLTGNGPQKEQTTAGMNVNYSLEFCLSLDKADCLAAIPWCGYVIRSPRRRFSRWPLLKTKKLRRWWTFLARRISSTLKKKSSAEEPNEETAMDNKEPGEARTKKVSQQRGGKRRRTDEPTVGGMAE